MTFAGIVACQNGTAFAARTDRASLFTIGFRSDPLLLWGIAFELVLTAAVIYLPPLQDLFGTASLGASQLAVLLPFPFVVWRRGAHPSGPPPPAARGIRGPCCSSGRGRRAGRGPGLMHLSGPIRPQIKPRRYALGVHSEVGQLRQAVVHRPGLELSRRTPANCRELLFDDVLWAAKAR